MKWIKFILTVLIELLPKIIHQEDLNYCLEVLSANDFVRSHILKYLGVLKMC